MCLTIKSEICPSELVKDGKIECYKFAKVRENKLFAPFAYLYEYSVGKNLPTSFSDNISDLIKQSHGGYFTISEGVIHAYVENVYIPIIEEDKEVIFKCWAYAEDFVALGHNNDICFKKLYIDEEEYKKAVSFYD